MLLYNFVYPPRPEDVSCTLTGTSVERNDIHILFSRGEWLTHHAETRLRKGIWGSTEFSVSEKKVSKTK